MVAISSRQLVHEPAHKQAERRSIMSGAGVVALGAIAGFTIFLGLPIGRIKRQAPRLKAFLNATSAGILLFLLWDILSHATAPIEESLGQAAKHHGSWLKPTEFGAIFVVGLGAGMLSLVYFEKWIGQRQQRVSIGPGAMAAAELTSATNPISAPLRIAWLIAAGIGLHNFSEGLAIGQSASRGAVSLTLLLVIGFGLHNATEGFGIVAPLSGGAERPSWKLLLCLGLVAGGPTFLGTIVGRSFNNEALYLGCLALAAGSVLYVLTELLHVGRKLGYKEILIWGLLIGLVVGFATDFVVALTGV